MDTRIALFTVAALSCAACQSAVRNTMYSAYEKVGVHKRDLLKKKVEKARDEQKDSSEEFKDALTTLKEVYAFDGGNLEKQYKAVERDYENARESAQDVHESIEKMDTVATDLFKEWEKEIKEIQKASYQAESRRQLRATRNRYGEMHEALLKAEKTMEPALAELKDQTLFLKHNLNARAVASLRGQGAEIQKEIDRVIQEVSASIKKADEFIAELSEVPAQG